MEEKVEVNKYDVLKTFLSERTCGPIKHPEFLLYFVIIIIVFGGIGVWDGLISGNSLNISKELIAYSIAIISAGTMELMFENNRIVRNIFIILSIGIIAAYFIFFLSIDSDSVSQIIVSIVLTLLSLYLWWVANANNTNLTKNYFVENSNTSKELGDSLSDFHEDE